MDEIISHPSCNMGASQRKTRKNVRRKRTRKTGVSERQKIKAELKRLTDAVRQKFRTIRQNTDSMQEYFEQSAKPLVIPLQQKIAESVKEVVVKKEPAETLLTPKKEESEITTQTEPLTTSDVSTQTDPGLSSKYLKKLSSVGQDKLDTVYGVRPDGSGGTMIGDSRIAFSNTHIYVQARTYRVTPGLMELLFMQTPNANLVDKDDVQVYKEIILLTNAHRQAYSAEKPINSNRGKKYVNVISVILKQEHSGSGLIGHMTSFDNANKVVDRLRILVLSKSAGHSGHDEEIEYLTEMLRENGVIY